MGTDCVCTNTVNAFDDLSGGDDAYIRREKEEDDGCGGEGTMLGQRHHHVACRLLRWFDPVEKSHFLRDEAPIVARYVVRKEVVCRSSKIHRRRRRHHTNHTTRLILFHIEDENNTMARGGRSSGSRSSSSSSGGGLFGAKRTPAPPAPARRAPPPPAPASHAPAPMQSQVPAQMGGGGGGMLSGIGSTIAQGMAFGTGSAIAHRAGKSYELFFLPPLV